MADGDTTGNTGPSKPAARAHGTDQTAGQVAKGTGRSEGAQHASDYNPDHGPVQRNDVTNANLHYGSESSEELLPDSPEHGEGAGLRPEAAEETPPGAMEDGSAATGAGAAQEGASGPPEVAGGNAQVSANTAGEGTAVTDSGGVAGGFAGADSTFPFDLIDRFAGATAHSDAGFAAAGAGTAGGGDDGGGGIGNTNEAPLDIALSRESVDENAASGTVVATLSTLDTDSGDTHTYALTDDPSGFFEIVGNEIRVKPGAAIDFEDTQAHDLTIEVTDSAGNSYSETVTLSVNDLIDETPTDIVLAGGTVEENAAGGIVVASLSTVDADQGDTHTYALTDDPSGLFEIVGSEIRVKPGAAIDFESARAHDLTVRVTDAGGNSYSEVVTLSVEDLVDEAPTAIVLAGGAVDENATAGTVVATLSTVDADQGDTHSYALADDPSGFFEIVGNEIRVKPGANIDFESASSHDVTVEVTDSGGNSYAEMVTLTVNDLNEAPTDITLAGGSVDENATGGTVVATLSTVDVDQGDSHSYALADDPSGLFEIVGNEIRVKPGAIVDFENASSHDVTVEVTDAAGNTYNEAVTLSVNDLNEAPTDITLAGGSIDENAGTGTVVATVSAIDQDAGDSHTYALTDDAGGRFVIDPQSGEISVAQLGTEPDSGPDLVAWFDVSDPANVTLSGSQVSALADLSGSGVNAAQGSAGSRPILEPGAMNGQSALYFDGVDDHIDIADHSLLNLSDYSARSFAMTIRTGDDVTSRQVVYEEGGTVNGFNVYIDNGTLYLGAWSESTGWNFRSVSTDVDPDTSYTITAVYDGDQGSFTGYVNGAEIGSVATGDTMHAHSGNIALGGLSQDTVFHDGDEGADSGYYFNGHIGEFAVYNAALDEPTRSAVERHLANEWVQSELDFESAETHDVTVQVTDAGGLSYTETVTLSLNNLMDEGPTDIVLSGGNVDENAAAGTVVATLTAVDADQGDTHSYTLTNDPSGFFEIVGNEIRVKAGAPIDFENARTHDLTVQVTDAGGNSYSETVTIDVNDVNEAPTDITLSNTAVDENAAGGTVIATLGAADQDAGESFTYSIVDDPSGNFEVTNNKGVGELRVAAGADFDFEAAASHDLVLEVRDSAGNTHEETVTVSVNDLNDAPTGITVTGASVAQDASAGTVVATASAVDEDSGDSHTYALNDDAGGQVSIDPATGEIRLSNPLDSSTQSAFTVNVEATDQQGASVSQDVDFRFGSDGADTVNGGAGTDVIYGLGGSDNLDGGTGDDVIHGDSPDAGVPRGHLSVNEGGATNQLAQIANFQDFPTDQLSFEMRFTIDQVPTGALMFASYAVNSTYDEEFALAAQPGGNLIVNIHDTGLTSDGVDTGIPLSTLADGNQHTLSMTWDNATGDLNVYVDGQVEYNGTYHQGVSLTQGGTFVLGQDQDSVGGGYRSSEIFSGSIDEVRIYDGVRSAQEIADNWDSELADPAGEPDLVANWQMNGESGGVVPDAAGANDLTLVNGASVIDTTVLAGDDILAGGEGADMLYGGAANDTLLGQAGDDVLSGGEGNDTLAGGDGSDLFLFAEGDGADVAAGGAGSSWIDTVQLSDAAGGSDLGTFGVDWTLALSEGTVESQDAESLTLSQDADGVITLQDGSEFQFTDFERVEF